MKKYTLPTLPSYYYKQKTKKLKTKINKTASHFIRKGDTKPKWILVSVSKTPHNAGGTVWCLYTHSMKQSA